MIKYNFKDSTTGKTGSFPVQFKLLSLTTPPDKDITLDLTMYNKNGDILATTSKTFVTVARWNARTDDTQVSYVDEYSVDTNDKTSSTLVDNDYISTNINTVKLNSNIIYGPQGEYWWEYSPSYVGIRIHLNNNVYFDPNHKEWNMDNTLWNYDKANNTITLKDPTRIPVSPQYYNTYDIKSFLGKTLALKYLDSTYKNKPTHVPGNPWTIFPKPQNSEKFFMVL
ncbi:hypothetical protein [Clostridium perfringens]